MSLSNTDVLNLLLKGTNVNAILKDLGVVTQPNLGGNVTDISSTKPSTEQSLPYSTEEKLLVDWYREFSKQDDGKALAAGMGKFSRFIQSTVARLGMDANSTKV